MKLEGKYTFKAARQKVWDVLLDQKVLASCLPGCERLEEVAPDQFEARVKIGVASVKGTYEGKVRILEKHPISSYRMAVEGSGAVGFVKGEATISLEDKGDTTDILYSGEAQIGGLVASIGQRMLGGVAKLMVNQFFKAMEKKVQ